MVVASFVAVRLFGLDDGTVLALPVSGMPYVAVGSVLVLAGTAVARARLLTIAAAVLVVVQLVWLVPRFVPAESADPDVRTAAPTLRVATSNTLRGRVDARALVRLVRSERVDVLAVEEQTPEGIRALAGAGLTRALPHRVVRADADTALYSRLPLRRAGFVVEGTSWPLASAEVPVGGRAVRLLAVHTFYPLGDARRWTRDLATIRTAAASNAILLGDFNATLDHAPLRGLLDAGMADTHAELGHGWAPTWPEHGTSPWPLLQLDHVLHGGDLTGASVSEHELPGTDHRAVVAELTVSRRERSGAT